MASGKKKRRGIQGDTPGVPRVTRSQTDQQQQPVAAAGTTNNRDDPPPVGRIAVDGSTGQPSSQTPPGGPEVLAAIFDAPATTVGNTVAVAAAAVGNDKDNSNPTTVKNNTNHMDRRDSLFGLAGRIHMLQDYGGHQFNSRRGSMGSLSDPRAHHESGPSLMDDDNKNDGRHHPITHMGNNNNSSTTNSNGDNANAWNVNSNSDNTFADEEANINYLAARAHAAQMLAAEESKRLEENLMRLEMRRMMMMMNRSQSQQQQRQQGDGTPSLPQVTTTADAQPITTRQSTDQSLMAMAQRVQQQFNQGHPFIRQNNVLMQTAAAAPSAQSNDGSGSTNILFQHQQMIQHHQQQMIQQQQQPAATLPQPRRPLSAYNIFFSEMRVEVLKETECDDEDDNNNKCSTNETRQGETNVPHRQQQEQQNDDQVMDHDKKDKQFENFAENLAKSRLTKDPKRRVHRKTHGKVSFVSLAKMVGEKWRALPHEKKKRYQELADADKVRYKREKAEVARALKKEMKRLKRQENDRSVTNI